MLTTQHCPLPQTGVLSLLIVTSPVLDSQDVTPKSTPGDLACSANQNETGARIGTNRVRNTGREHSGLVLNIPTGYTSPFWFLPHSQFPPQSEQAAAGSSAPRSTSPYQRLWRHLLDMCSLHPSKTKEYRGCQWELTQAVPSPGVTTSHYSPPTPRPGMQPSVAKPKSFPRQGTSHSQPFPLPGKLLSKRDSDLIFLLPIIQHTWPLTI